MDIVYLDWAASAIPDKEIIAQTAELSMNVFGNPSSQHREGEQAFEILTRARTSLAGLIGCTKENIVFTSGGTESNAQVIHSLLSRKRKNGIVCSTLEHASIYEYARRLEQYDIPVRFADPDRLCEEIDEATAMIAIMTVNNETGQVLPLPSIIRSVREKERTLGSKIHIHTDAVQALGKIPFHPGELDVDSASFSAHKLGGPKGVGALFVKKQVEPLLLGGGQEGGYRAGTENVAGIHGFVLAAGKRIRRMEEEHRRAESLRNQLVASIRSLGQATVMDDESREYSPYIVSACFPPIPGEVLVRVLSDRGYAVSTGSACSSRKKNKTRVLEHSGVSREEAASALRISLGYATNEEDVHSFCRALADEVGTLRKVTG